MVKRDVLLAKGFFPETLPPCFDSTDLPRAMRGMIGALESKQFWKNRSTQYVRYIGTKHDGNRRPYSTPNPISYFHVANLISNYWGTFERKFGSSPFAISRPQAGGAKADRAIAIPPLSELSGRLSQNIRYAPFILKTDIAQYFPSIYTHAIPWVAHGNEAAKGDRDPKSKKVRFNQLDWACQQCQDGQTRGVLIGPDAFRIIAEFIASQIDLELQERAGDQIIGAVRHVDDFYIGVRSELDATLVLSHLRDILQNYELQINDVKTKIISGLEPVDDVWAQNLRSLQVERASPLHPHSEEKTTYAIDTAYETAKRIGSESPFKLIVRRLDQARLYRGADWDYVEPKLQRALYHFPHCMDYICLLTAKRFAIGGKIDISGWGEAAAILLQKQLHFNHHHEIVWLLWLIFVCKLHISQDMIEKLSKVQNGHIRALLIAAYQDGLCPHDPNIKLGEKLNTTHSDWLENLVGRSSGYTRAKFSGNLKEEFEHLARRKVRLINFKSHMDTATEKNREAISRSKYGYDTITDDENNGYEPDIDDYIGF